LRTPITRNGYEQLQAELERIKKVERPKVIQAIADARSHGDLSENAEYHAAKERQGFIEGKIKELESKLVNAQIIESHQLTEEKVVFGTTVSLLDPSNGEIKKYTLVGQHESDLKSGKISVASPVGKALIGHKVGDKVTVKTPARTLRYEIREITIE
jgi:transcription elongation factor GreA